jgi:hypothetical protein
MWAASDAISRTLIWLTVFALPLQPLPSTDCDCRSVGVLGQVDVKLPDSDCFSCQQTAEETSCCHREAAKKPSCCCSASAGLEGRCCCTQRKTQAAKAGCCSAFHHKMGVCNCGQSCRCGERREPVPAAPPASDRPGEELTCEAALLELSDLGDHRRLPLRRDSLHADANVIDSLERCAALCRFTL